MKNIFKEFFKKRKELKAQRSVSNYGDISIECIYHDDFIRIMDIFHALENGTTVSRGSDIYSTETSVETSVKGETLTLNSSGSIFKQSVLCAIDESVRNYYKRQEDIYSKPEVCILDCSNIVLKLVIGIGTDSCANFLKIFSTMLNNLDAQMRISEDKAIATLIISGSWKWFDCFKDNLIEEKLLDDNIIAVKIVDYIKTIIPQYGTNDGNSYFTGLSNTVRYIEPYSRIVNKVQILDHTNLENLNLKEYINKDDIIFGMQQIYLIVDNAEDIARTFNMCNLTYKAPGIDRYLIRISFNKASQFIDKLKSLELEDYVKKDMRDNIISKIKNIIPSRVLDPSSYLNEYEDPEYTDVDEIIEN